MEKNKALITRDTSAITIGEEGMIVTTLAEIKELANLITNSGMCPKAFVNKSEDAVVAILYGKELGMKPIQALQNIAVVNGTPSIWGDMVPGLVIGSGHEDWHKITEVGPKPSGGNYHDDFGITYTTKRNGKEPYGHTFTVADAKAAKLWKKVGTWTQYPTLMLLYRARTFACRIVYPDVMKGIHTVEEMRDADIRDVEYTVVETSSKTEQLAAAITPKDEPAEPAQPEEKKEPGPIEQVQIKHIYAMCKNEYDLGKTDALTLVAEIVKHEVGSMKDLTDKEAVAVIEVLQYPETTASFLSEIERRYMQKKLAEEAAEQKQTGTPQEQDMFNGGPDQYDPRFMDPPPGS